ncbi:NUDIX hydrolase [Paracoccus onubensis]|uniref:NUDIX domain-containing protein n=1 Tax=Paracoccus onubensis TaxID=1675788 RepID=A0A418T3V4_9RHOB|nr:NUDIX hydrolase [Paracoccus onubensis]RJE87893.1 NUDIX domain-containing protein [Paracoccus onubensis]
MNALLRSIRLLFGKRPRSLQVGAVCRDPDSGKVLLITSRGTGRWVIPKGWPMAGRSLAGAAAREAWEEAGVEGQVSDAELGRYRYDKAQESGFSVPVDVAVYALKVTALQDAFPEAAERERQWFTPIEAEAAVAEPGLKTILRGLSAAPS